MGRGLGNMQRAILAGLQPAWQLRTDDALAYCGGSSVRYIGRTRDPRGTVFSHGKEFDLPADTYDLRGVLRLLAEGAEAWDRYAQPREIASPFAKSFSRAAHGLVDRKVLDRYGWKSQPLRFVKLVDPEAPLPKHPWVDAAVERLIATQRQREAWCQRIADAYRAKLDTPKPAPALPPPATPTDDWYKLGWEDKA